MGWWATGHDDDLMGDEPADTIVGELKFHEEMNGRKPSFQELIDAATLVLRTDGGDILADPESLGDRSLEAVFEPPAPSLATRPNLPALVSRPELPVSKLMFDLVGAFNQISRQYLETELHRKPRLTELLEALAFPLRVRPERVLRDSDGLELREFRVAGSDAGRGERRDFRPPSTAELERVLREHRGDEDRAAAALGLPATKLRAYLKAAGIDPDEHR